MRKFLIPVIALSLALASQVPASSTEPSVDGMARSIANSAAATVKEIAEQRATLPYGEIYPAAGLPDQLTLYPPPDGIPASDQYSVTVNEQPSFVYKALARKTDTNRELDTSWTSLSFSGRITFSVTKLTPGATGCLVRPSSAAIATSFAANTCTFSVSTPGHLSVEFLPNVNNPVVHPMLVFANPPEVDVPSPSDPNVRYFGPGVHTIGAGQPLLSGQTIYLAGGAYVHGAFIADGAVSNVTIKGRGILDGLFMDTGNQDLNKDVPGMINITDQASSNVLIEGITLVNGPRFNIRALAHHTTIHNVKVMSWWYSTDGMVGGNKSLLENNFIKVNDDSVKLFWGNTIARHNTIWQLENGASFMISWNIHLDGDTFHVYDNDVIHVEHNGLAKPAVFRSLHAGSATLSRYLFEDIRVEDATWRLFYLVLENNKWYDPNLGYGEIAHVIFRDIRADATFRRPNLVSGIDPDHMMRDISFQNISANGVCFDSPEAGNFQIDPGTTKFIRIDRDLNRSCGA